MKTSYRRGKSVIPVSISKRHPRIARWIAREGDLRIGKMLRYCKVIITTDTDAFVRMVEYLEKRLWNRNSALVRQLKKTPTGFGGVCCGLRSTWYRLDGLVVEQEYDPRLYALVVLNGEYLNVSYVVHELVHAAYKFAQRFPKFPWPDTASEEDVAYPAGELSSALIEWLWPATKKNPLAQRRGCAKMRSRSMG
jgi:hypothetical protein